MLSDKVKDIPKEQYKALETSLSELKGTKTEYFSRRLLARKSGVRESKTQILLSALCDEGVLDAELEIRCPSCDQNHGRFVNKSKIPTDSIRCFCGEEVVSHEKSNWRVVYKIAEAKNEFFPERKRGFKQLIEASRDLSSGYFLEAFEELQQLDDPQERGRLFDYFIGLIFNQLSGVEVIIGREVPIGEVDVFISCLDAESWLHRLVGDVTMIENKWTESPIQTKEISGFHDKVGSAPLACDLAYFVSMSGFTSSGEMSASQLMKSKSEPKLIGLESEDIQKMVQAATPEPVLRDRVMG